jgi:hypothetical protein
MPWKRKAPRSGTAGPKVLADLGADIVEAALALGQLEVASLTLERVAMITGGWTPERRTKPRGPRPGRYRRKSVEKAPATESVGEAP